MRPSDGRGPFIIAELGVNHDGSPARLAELVRGAAAAGADAVKLQLFEPSLLLSRGARAAGYQARAGEHDPFAMLSRLALPVARMRPAVDLAHELGLRAIVTVFSVELVDGARSLDWDAFKSASPDIVHRPLLEAVAADGRPLIVSTGASTIEEVERAAGWLDGARDRLTLLQCVSCYPAREEDAAVGAMVHLRERTGLPVGYSDHTTGVGTGARAAAMGARVLEKHLTLDRRAPGPDHASSLEPAEFAEYVRLARRAAPASDGPGERKRVLDCERDVRSASRQSVTTRRAMRAGERVERADLTFKRPGSGIEPWMVGEVVGRTLARDIGADTPVRESDIG